MLIIYSVNATINKYLNNVIVICCYVSVLWGAICYTIKIISNNSNSSSSSNNDGVNGNGNKIMEKIQVWG